MKNILYISYDGMTDPLGQSQVLPYLTGLSKKGFNIYLLSFEKSKNYKKYQSKIEAITREAKIIWYPKSYSKYPPVFSTLYDIIRIIHWSKKIFKLKNINLVHCRSYIAAFGGYYLKQKFNVKFVFDIRGFWPDERMESGIWNKNNFIYKIVYQFFKYKERQFFNTADLIISLTHAAEKEIHSWPYLKKQPIPIEVIPTCTDLKHFSKKSVNNQQLKKLKKYYQITPHMRVISYLGSLGNWNLIEEMFDFFKLYKQKYNNVKFLILSHTSRSFIEQNIISKKLALKDFILTNSERENLPTLIALSTFSVFFVKPSYSQNASAPTKLGELMAMGIPVVVNKGYGDVSNIVAESKSGVVIEDFSKPYYLKAINQINKIISSDIIHISDNARLYFSLEKGINKYRKVYIKLLNIC